MTILYIVIYINEKQSTQKIKTYSTHVHTRVQRGILTGMLLSSCTSALGRPPFFFPSAKSSNIGPG